MGEFPDAHYAFARELVAVARKHRVDNLKVEFRHPLDRDSPTTFYWDPPLPFDGGFIVMMRSVQEMFDDAGPSEEGA